MALEAISLVKNQKVDLTKTNPGLTKISVGLGWDTNAGNGAKFDLDASVVAMNDAGEKLDLIYFGQLNSKDGSVHHTGDNLTGEGDGDDETIEIDLSKVDAGTTKFAVLVNIYEAEQRHQNFGMVKNAFIRVYNTDTKDEILKYDLSEDASSGNGMLFGTLYSRNGEWKFESNSAPKNGDLNQMVASL